MHTETEVTASVQLLLCDRPVTLPLVCTVDLARLADGHGSLRRIASSYEVAVTGDPVVDDYVADHGLTGADDATATEAMVATLEAALSEYEEAEADDRAIEETDRHAMGRDV